MNKDIEVLLGTVPLLPPAEQNEFYEKVLAQYNRSMVDSLTNLAASCGNVPVDKRVARYVKLRDQRAATNKQSDLVDQAYKQTLETIEKSLIADAHKQGVTGFKTEAGTTYLEEKTMASIADENAFFGFVLEQGDLDFFERRIKSTHIKEWSAANEGKVPPGLNTVSYTHLTLPTKRIV